jgi:hypothetical protein
MLQYQYIRVEGHPSIWSTVHWSSFSFIADANHVGEQFKILFPLHIMKYIISLIYNLFTVFCPQAYSVIFKYRRNIVLMLISHYLLNKAIINYKTRSLLNMYLCFLLEEQKEK